MAKNFLKMIRDNKPQIQEVLTPKQEKYKEVLTQADHSLTAVNLRQEKKTYFKCLQNKIYVIS